MGSADYDLLLHEIGQEIRRTGLDKGGYTIILSNDEPAVVFEEEEKT